MHNHEERKDLTEKVSQLEARVLELEQLNNSSRERVEFLEEILDSIPPIISAWGKDGIMKFVNQSFLNLSGFQRDAVVGASFNDLYPPQEIDRVVRVYNQLEHEPDGASSTTRVNGVTADGKWLFIDGTTIKKNAPPIGGFVGYGVNVTDQATAETDYKESVEAMGTIFNSVQDGLLIHDRTGSFVQFNQKVSDMFGISMPDIVLSVPPLKAEKFYCPEDDSFDLRSKWEDVLAGENKQWEYRIRRESDGKLFDVDVFMCPIQLRGHEHILVSIKDITEKKRVADELQRTMILAEKLRKRAEAASEAKSKFLANMSHELRTPLNAILGFSELLEGQFYGAINQKQSAYLKAIHGSGAHLLQLINDILDIAKVEAGKMEMTPSTTDLSQLLENSVTMIKEMAHKGGVDLALDIAPELYTQHVMADDVRLKQIVMNLLSNAVKFTPSGGMIRMKARVEDHEVRVSISDNGIGIKAEDQEMIFEEFEQIDSSFSRQHEGTGLGLSLTKKLVELHGGRIWVESEGENKGSIFTFEFPYILASPKDTEEFSESGDPQLLTIPDAHALYDNRPSILVVEDNSANMKLTTNLLQLAGYKALPAFTSEEAIAILKTQTPALILMDISLPGMDGLRATKAIKNNPATATIPVVALTAHAMKDDEARALEAGCSAYLVKPIDTRKFYRTIWKILKPMEVKQ